MDAIAVEEDERLKRLWKRKLPTAATPRPEPRRWRLETETGSAPILAEIERFNS
jgi:hypothetical protein